MLSMSNVYRDIDNLIDTDTELRCAVIQAMNKKYLAMHKSKVWFDENKQLFCTKLDGKNKTSKTMDGLNKKIIEFYESQELSFRVVLEEELQKNLRQKKIVRSTYDRYYNDYDRYIKNTVLDTTPVSLMTSKQIRRFLEAKIEVGISDANFSKLVSMLNLVYFNSGKTDIDVLLIKRQMKITPKQFDKSNKRNSTEIVWTDGEQAMLTDYCLSHADDIRVLGILFILQTGLAISELVQLHKADIDIVRKEMSIGRIERSYKENGVTTYHVSKEHTAKTETRLNTVYLSDKAIQTYKAILNISTAKDEDDLIFNGYRTYDFSHTLRRHILKDLGLSDRGLHSLRKTYCTNLIDSALPLKLVQNQMRHANIETTLRHYYKRKASKEEALQMLNAV